MSEKNINGVIQYSEPLMIVKIDISRADGYGCDDVIYYRYKLPMEIMLRYKWYFEYLAALVKVQNPKRRVTLRISRQDDKTGDDLVLCGQDFIEARRPKLITGKKRTITKIKNKDIEADLFGIREHERNKKIEDIQSEIDALERGEFNYYVPPTYINKIKKRTRSKT